MSAVQLFDEMRERNVKPDVVCYNVLINELLKRGEYEKGMGISERLLRDWEVKPNVTTHDAVLSGLCRTGRFEEVMEMWSCMVRNGHRLDSVTYGILIHWL